MLRNVLIYSRCHSTVPQIGRLKQHRFVLTVWDQSVSSINFLRPLLGFVDGGLLLSSHDFPSMHTYLYPHSLFIREVTQSCPILCDPMDCSPPGSSVHGVFQARGLEVGCHFLLQGIFLTQGLNPGIPHCRQMLYPPSHQGSPWTLISLFLEHLLSKLYSYKFFLSSFEM